LRAYELALAINRLFNALLTSVWRLKKAGYIHDAAQELERLLAANPVGESPAHLAMVHLTPPIYTPNNFIRPSRTRPYLKSWNWTLTTRRPPPSATGSRTRLIRPEPRPIVSHAIGYSPIFYF